MYSMQPTVLTAGDITEHRNIVQYGPNAIIEFPPNAFIQFNGEYPITGNLQSGTTSGSDDPTAVVMTTLVVGLLFVVVAAMFLSKIYQKHRRNNQLDSSIDTMNTHPGMATDSNHTYEQPVPINPSQYDAGYNQLTFLNNDIIYDIIETDDDDDGDNAYIEPNQTPQSDGYIDIAPEEWTDPPILVDKMTPVCYDNIRVQNAVVYDLATGTSQTVTHK